jgi:ATP-dependent Zn protease
MEKIKYSEIEKFLEIQEEGTSKLLFISDENEDKSELLKDIFDKRNTNSLIVKNEPMKIFYGNGLEFEQDENLGKNMEYHLKNMIGINIETDYENRVVALNDSIKKIQLKNMKIDNVDNVKLLRDKLNTVFNLIKNSSENFQKVLNKNLDNKVLEEVKIVLSKKKNAIDFVEQRIEENRFLNLGLEDKLEEFQNNNEQGGFENNEEQDTEAFLEQELNRVDLDYQNLLLQMENLQMIEFEVSDKSKMYLVEKIGKGFFDNFLISYENGMIENEKITIYFKEYCDLLYKKALGNIYEEVVNLNHVQKIVESSVFIFDNINNPILIEELLENKVIHYEAVFLHEKIEMNVNVEDINIIILESKSSLDLFELVDKAVYIESFTKEDYLDYANDMLRREKVIFENQGVKLNFSKPMIDKVVDKVMEMNKNNNQGFDRLERSLYLIINPFMELINKGEFEKSFNVNSKMIDNVFIEYKKEVKLEKTNDLEFYESEEKFENILGLKNVKNKMKEVSWLYKLPIEDIKKNKIKKPKGMILYGKPGVGKTMVAKAFANEIGAYFCYDTMENFTSSNGKEKIPEYFEKVKQWSLENPSEILVLFFDEMDSLRKRGDSSHNNSYYDGITNNWLYQIDNIPNNVIIIGATNRIDGIDEAIKRDGRLSLVIEVENKFTVEEVKKFISKEIPTFSEELLETFSKMTYYKNGSEISEIINSIKINLLSQEGKEKLTSTLLKKWIFNEKYDLYSFENKNYSNVESVAWHEAGHAVVFLIFREQEKLHEISIYPIQGALGFISYNPELNDNGVETKEEMEQFIMMALAGRYAEKMFTKKISSGASADLDQANQQLRYMITKLGMYGSNFIMRDDKEVSQKTLKYIDKIQKKEMKRLTKKTKKLIVKNKNSIKLMVKDLMEEKVIVDNFEKYMK